MMPEMKIGPALAMYLKKVPGLLKGYAEADGSLTGDALTSLGGLAKAHPKTASALTTAIPAGLLAKSVYDKKKEDEENEHPLKKLLGAL